MGRIVAAYRRHPYHGSPIPQDVVAGWANITQAQVSRIERGAPEQHLDRLNQWADLLHIPEGLLWFARPNVDSWPAPQSSTGPVETTDTVLEAGPFNGEDHDVQRRSLLTLGVAAMLDATVPETTFRGRRIDSSNVTKLRLRLARLRRLDDYLGGADTIELYRSELDSTVSVARESSYSHATGTMLQALIAEQAQLVGWAAFDAGATDSSRRMFVFSHSVAEEAGDRALAGNALALMAYQKASLGEPDVDMALESCAYVATDIPPSVQALWYERLAFTYAIARQPGDADRALTRARQALACDKTERPGPHWAAWVNDHEIDIMTGRVWAQLKRPLRAVPLLDGALGRLDDAQARDKALYLTWLAEAYVDASEPEEAAAVLRTSRVLADSVASPRPAMRIAAVRQRLAGYPELIRAIDAPP